MKYLERNKFKVTSINGLNVSFLLHNIKTMPDDKKPSWFKKFEEKNDARWNINDKHWDINNKRWEQQMSFNNDVKTFIIQQSEFNNQVKTFMSEQLLFNKQQLEFNKNHEH